MAADKYSLTEEAISMLESGVSVTDLVTGNKKDTLESYLFDYICMKDMSVEVVAGLADLNKASLYRILKGQLNPRRNVLIRLAFVLGMSISETQQLLKLGDTSPLSGTKPRDLYIMEGIIHHKSIDEVNDTLLKGKFQDLFTK